jgi:hypothetical protein
VTSPLSSITSLDSILFTDPTTNRTFVYQLAGACSIALTTDDDGATYTPATCPPDVVFDHETIGTGPYPKSSLIQGIGYPNAVYYCADTGSTDECGRSDDGGLTFNPGVVTDTQALDMCDGLSGHIKVGPEGTVYVPRFNCGGTAAVTISKDAGLTWKVHHIPGSTTQNESDPSIGTSTNGVVYFGWENGADNSKGSTADMAVSHDQGQTWSRPFDVGAQLGIKNVQFPEVVAGDDDRAAIAFLGSTTAGNDQLKGFPGTFDLYVSTTYDGGRTWKTVDATPKDPAQRGGIDLGGSGSSGGAVAVRNLLDFNDMSIDKTGRVFVGWADGCTKACVTSTKAADNAYDHLGTITRQQSGLTLYKAFDPTVAKPTVPAKPTIPATTTRPTAPTVAHGALAATGLGVTLPALALALVGVALVVLRRHKSRVG